MKKAFTLVLLLSTLLFVSCGSQSKPSPSHSFDSTKVLGKYQSKDTKDYIAAVCDYCNEVTRLCDDLKEKDFSVLIESPTLETLRNNEDRKYKSIMSADKLTADIAEIHLSILSINYQIAKYNADNVKITFIKGEIVRGATKSNIEPYYEIMEKLGDLEKTLIK